MTSKEITPEMVLKTLKTKKMSHWKYYKDVNFSDVNIARYNIDTRDFYCAVQTKAEMEQYNRLIATLDTSQIDKYPVSKFYHT